MSNLFKTGIKEKTTQSSGAETLARLVKLSDIQLHADFESLFAINPAVQGQVVSRIKKYGYDKSQPIHIWKEKQVLIDGHTRRVAAIECGLLYIPAYEHSFESTEDALEYALGLQTARRNLSDAEIVNAIAKLNANMLKKPGRIGGDEISGVEKGKSAEHLSKVLGTSTTKIERARAIEKKATDEVKVAVSTGEMTINAGYNTTRQPIEIKQTIEDPSFYLSEILNVLRKRKLYSLAFVLFEELKVDKEVEQCFIKTLPKELQKSFEIEVRKAL